MSATNKKSGGGKPLSKAEIKEKGNNAGGGSSKTAAYMIATFLLGMLAWYAITGVTSGNWALAAQPSNQNQKDVTVTLGVNQSFVVDSDNQYTCTAIQALALTIDPNIYQILKDNPWINTTQQFSAYVQANDSKMAGYEGVNINILGSPLTITNGLFGSSNNFNGTSIAGDNVTYDEPGVWVLFQLQITLCYTNGTVWHNVNCNGSADLSNVNASDIINVIQNLGQPTVNAPGDTVSIYLQSISTVSPNAGHDCKVNFLDDGKAVTVDGNFV
jgi:hypothetical protein